MFHTLWQIMLDKDIIKRFARIFSGYTKNYGVYTPKGTGKDERGKAKGANRTAPADLTEKQYELHLSGEQSLGVIMLREDDTVLFAAIDYDKDYLNSKASLDQLEKKINELRLPLVLCRSKSGGGHLYLFLSEPVDASIVKQRLSLWCAKLGLAANTEQFPKQASRNGNDKIIGNWINLPYFGINSHERYALINGERADIETFLDYAEMLSVSAEFFNLEESDDDIELFVDGPPCLQEVERQGGFQAGQRNNGMFSVAVYLRNRYPENWQDHLDRYNDVLAKLPSTEIVNLQRSHEKKEYGYKCSESPCQDFCQKKLCATRPHGIKYNAEKSVDIQNVTCYYSPEGPDESFWDLEINGQRVFVSTRQLYHVNDFNQACMNQINSIPVHMSQQKWLLRLDPVVQNADKVPLPEDINPTGQLWVYITDFLTSDRRAHTWEDIVTGKPYIEDGIVYFRSVDLVQYLEKRRAITVAQKNQLPFILEKKGGKHQREQRNDKRLRVWSLPLPDVPELQLTSENIQLDSEEF